jgi:hypothetical protein
MFQGCPPIPNGILWKTFHRFLMPPEKEAPLCAGIIEPDLRGSGTELIPEKSGLHYRLQISV